ncbi:hypothetical protein [uncultured Desulfosarcina sp.]|uniref:hypothetical protein n=1 Tax=uncultured Desulfosarcina sp. TaxID=218289 RepID=UPI0029C99647|nr:hypothetical protein [uncultured Desulfosarcina sp.]
MAAVLYLALALATTWPLVGSCRSCLPLGTEPVATVPLFNVWTIWWNADRAAAGYQGYWDAPIFHPVRRTFAFSEPMPLTVAAAPIIWITGNRILAYNCLLLGALLFNGWITFRLLRGMHYHWLVALSGGAMMELLPLVHSWLGVLELVPLFGVLWSLLALYRISRRPTVTGGLVLGTALACTYLMCAYYGLMMFVLLAVCGPWLVWRRAGRRRMWTALLPGVLAGGLLCFPVVWGQYAAIGEKAFHRPEAYLTRLSATVADYNAAPWRPAVNIGLLADGDSHHGFRLCPGTIKLILAAAGLFWGLASWRRRDWTFFCLTLMGLAFLLSLGPRVQVWGWKPYLQLVDSVPGFAQVRNVFRAAVFVQVAVVLMAVMALQAGVTVTGYLHHSHWRRGLRGIIIAVGILAVVEILPPAQPLYAVPPLARNRGWIEWLRDQTPAESVVVCVPLPFMPDVASYEREACWMYWGTFHRRRMANGYSGFFPPSFTSLKMQMADFPAAATVDRLAAIGVDYCVVKSDTYLGQQTRNRHGSDRRLIHVFHDRLAQMDIYRLMRP